MTEDKRIAGRRKRARRMYDALHGKVTEEERQQYDKLLWSRIVSEDRRVQERRTEKDRRA
jgi:hypothetical protein